MGVARNLYFMGLVGALAGLICWSVAVWVPEAVSVPQELFWLIDLIQVGASTYADSLISRNTQLHVDALEQSLGQFKNSRPELGRNAFHHRFTENFLGLIQRGH